MVTTTLTLIVGAYLLAAFVHMSYVYAMGLKWARDNGGIPAPVYVFAGPTALVMITFYVLLNLTRASVLRWSRPLSDARRPGSESR